MIITDRIRRDIKAYRGQGFPQSTVLRRMVQDYNLYDGFVSSRFIRDRAEMQSAIAAEFASGNA